MDLVVAFTVPVRPGSCHQVFVRELPLQVGVWGLWLAAEGRALFKDTSVDRVALSARPVTVAADRRTFVRVAYEADAVRMFDVSGQIGGPPDVDRPLVVASKQRVAVEMMERMPRGTTRWFII